MRLFQNSGEKISLSCGTQCFLVIVLCIINFFGRIRLDETFACNGAYSFCTIESHNAFNIKSSKKLFIPKEVSFAVVDSYTAVRGRRNHRRSVKFFSLDVVLKNKKTITLFKDFSNYGKASELKDGVMTCIQQGPYPCKVKR